MLVALKPLIFLDFSKSYNSTRTNVGAKSALLRRLFMPMTKKTSSARSLAPPLQITTAALGCDLVFGANLKAAASIVLRCSKNPERDRVRDFYFFQGLLFVHHGEDSNRLPHCVPPVAQLPGERFFMAREVFLFQSFP